MIKSILILAFATIVIAAAHPHHAGSVNYAEALRKLQKAVRSEGCEPNVCFAIETSGSLTIEEFDLARFFMIDVTAIIGGGSLSKFAAVHFGKRAYPISGLVSDIAIFHESVDDAQFINEDSRRFGSGVFWCGSQLRRSIGDSRHIVLLATGGNNIELSPAFSARFEGLRKRNVISAISVRSQDTETLTEITGDASRVFIGDDSFELSEVVDVLVNDICGSSLIQN